MNITDEANRYIENAQKILSEKANKEDGYYQDKKYVKMAGHTAYVGVLYALDGFLGVKKKSRKNVDFYKSELAKLDKKLLNYFDSAYEILHLSMGYDGNSNATVAKEGLSEAKKIISWVSNRMQA